MRGRRGAASVNIDIASGRSDDAIISRIVRTKISPGSGAKRNDCRKFPLLRGVAVGPDHAGIHAGRQIFCFRRQPALRPALGSRSISACARRALGRDRRGPKHHPDPLDAKPPGKDRFRHGERTFGDGFRFGRDRAARRSAARSRDDAAEWSSRTACADPGRPPRRAPRSSPASCDSKDGRATRGDGSA